MTTKKQSVAKLVEALEATTERVDLISRQLEDLTVAHNSVVAQLDAAHETVSVLRAEIQQLRAPGSTIVRPKSNMYDPSIL